LLFWGVMIGFLSAIVAVFPNFIAQGSDVSFVAISLIVLAILINGIFWIVLLSRLALRGKKLISNI